MTDLNKLAELKGLFDSGALTEDEFQSEKEKILNAPDPVEKRPSGNSSDPVAGFENSGHKAGNPPPSWATQQAGSGAPITDRSSKGSWIMLLLRIVVYSGVAILTFAFFYLNGPQILQKLLR